MVTEGLTAHGPRACGPVNAARDRRCGRCPHRLNSSRAFTLVELLITLAIIMTISAMAVPRFSAALDAARVARAVGDIRTLQNEIALFEALNGRLPANLAELGRGELLDPWRNPYQFLNFAAAGRGVRGQQRKDRFLVPINSTYDLYSMGKDRRSRPPLTARDSHDDVIRASDGGFIGLALQF